MFDNDFHFLRNVVIMQAHPLIQPDLGFFGIDLFVGFFNFLFELIHHFIVGIVFQHIQNKAFFNGLTHGVDMKSFWLVLLGGW
ncbi:Uncharacterised protein [Mycobacteroides abscessus subsp. abscessus]|nr:Uncharacterised protein [Mycobacteroides abscessus subsp. abscessus]